MRTRFTVRFPIILLAFALLLPMAYIPPGSTVSAAATTYYVDAASGDDASGDGTSNSPWQTIGKAAAVAQAGDTVKIRSGTYRETVTPAHSGAEGAPITYEADTGADVTISGADVVTSSWTVHAGNIYKTAATLGMGEWRNQVFVDGEAMQLARWPNADETLLTSSTALTDAGTDDNHVMDSELTQPDGYWNGAGVVVTDRYAWNLSSTLVTSYTTGRLNLGSISTFGLTANSPYYLVGKLSELDTGKEWYYDSSTSTLYLQTPTGDSPASHVVEVKARNLAFDLAGKNYIHIRGIKLFANTLSTNASHDIDLDGLNVKYPTHYEIDPPGVSTDHEGIKLGGTNNILHNSTLAYAMGALVTATGENNQIVNNLMHDAAYGPFYGTASIIQVSGRELLISNNTLYNSGAHVIDGRPLNSRIQYNYAYNAMTHTDDGGFFYFSNVDGEGTEIHHNILHGANSSSIDGGIYLDFACWDFSVFDNVISDVNGFGVFFHAYTLFTTAYNNTFYNKSWFRMKNDGGAADAYGTRIINNITYDDLWTAPGFGVVERSNFKEGDPMFVDAPNRDFHLQPSSTAIDAGEVIEGITDGYVGSAPDIGAFESGAPAWTAGHDFANPPHPTFTTTNMRYRQLIKNGFFERDVDPSKDWTKTFSQSSSIQTSGITATVSRYQFTRGLQLGSGEDGVVQTVTGLQPNTEYELRGFAKAAASGQKVRIGVKDYGGQDTYKELDATSWAKGKFRFTTGPSDTSATIYVTKTTTGGFAYVDDVTLMEVDPNGPPELDVDYEDDDSSPSVTAINDRDTGTGLNQFEFVGTWLTGPNLNYYKGDGSFSNTPEDYYQVRFEGTQVKLYTEKNDVSGIIAVSVDGGPEALIDLYAETAETQFLAFTSDELAMGTHILKVRITGDKNAASGGTWNGADKVEIIHPPTKTINDRDTGTGLNQYDFSGTWLTGPNLAYYKGDGTWSNTPGDFYQIRFEGTQIKLYSEKNNVGGIIAVSVDGGPETLIDLYAETAQAQYLVFTSDELAMGTHILKVRLTGDKNPASGGTWNGADKVVVTIPNLRVVNDREIGNGLYQFKYTGNWLQGPNINAYKGDASFSNTAGDYYQVRFKGTQIKVYSEKQSVAGIVGISIDSGPETLVDMYSEEDLTQELIYTSPELTDGEHVLKVRITGEMNPSAGGTWHVADKVEITLGADTGTDPGTGTELVDRYAEDFESTDAGSLPAGWRQATTHAVGVTVDSEGNHILTLVEPGNDGVGTGASVDFDPIHTKARVHVRVMAEQIGRTNDFLQLLDSNGNRVVDLLFDYDWDGVKDSHFIGRRTPDGNWSNMIDYNANQWYDVEVDIDFLSATYDVIIDGNIVADDIGILSPSTDIASYVNSTYGWDTGTFHADDIRIEGPDAEPTPAPGPGDKVPHLHMTATATSQDWGYEPVNAIDGNNDTIWASKFTEPAATLPQSITLNLGDTYHVDKLEYLPRQDGSSNGVITSYNVYTSTDGTNFDLAATGTWSSDRGLKTAKFDAVDASYIKLEALGALSDDGTGRYATAAEINVIIADPNPPTMQPVYEQDFESTDVGALPSGWTQATSHAVGVTADGEGNHSLTFVEPGNDGVGTGASVSFDPIHDKAQVNVRVMAEQLGRTINFLTLLDSQGTKVLELMYDFDYDNSGRHNISRRTPDNNWSDLMAYNANQWYDVQADVDLNAGTYDIKIDGNDIAAGIPLLSAATDIAKYTISTYGWNAGTFHVDDIRISALTTAPQQVDVADIEVAGENGASAITEPAGSLQMTAAVTPDNATNKAVVWSVVAEDGSAADAATIDANGLLTAIADGKVKVVATAKDESGVSGEALVTIDVTAPVIASPGNLTFLQTEPIELNFTAADAISGLQSLEVTFNGQTTDGSISLDPLALGVGTYPIVVTATDNVGHQSTATFSLVITVDIDHLDELIATGLAQGLIDNGGTANSLMSHVKNIQRDADNEKKLQNSIKSMKNTVNAQRGKHIDASFADLILADLDAILNGDNTPPAGDTQAPSAPTGLAAASVTDSSVSLTWTASTDDVGVTGYTVFRDGAEVGTAATTSYTDSGLTAGTTYTYTVIAHDAAGNASAASDAAQAATDDADSGSAIYSEDFDSTTIGQMPDGWTINTPGGSASVQQVADGANTTNQALTLTQTSYGVADVSAAKSFAPSTGVVTFDLSMMADQTNSLLSGPNLSDSNGTTILQLAFKENGRFGYVSSAIAWTDTPLAYAANQWYDVHVVVDLATDTFDLSIDGTAVLTNEPLMAAADDVSQIGFGTNMWYPGTVHYDGIRVSQ